MFKIKLNRAAYKNKALITLISLALFVAFYLPALAEGQLPDQQHLVDYSHETNLKESLLLAKKRFQPYINLTDRIYNLGDLINPGTIKQFESLELKSIYILTDRIRLDEKFAEQINTLIKHGTKEILIFIYQNQPSMDVEKFNAFLELYKIRINLAIAPIDTKTINTIFLFNDKKIYCGLIKLSKKIVLW